MPAGSGGRQALASADPANLPFHRSFGPSIRRTVSVALGRRIHLEDPMHFDRLSLFALALLPACSAPVMQRTTTIHVAVAAPSPVTVQPPRSLPTVVVLEAPPETNAAQGPATLVTCSPAQRGQAGSPVTVSATSNRADVHYTWHVFMSPRPAIFRFANQFDPQDTNAEQGAGARVPFVTPIVGSYTLQAEARDEQQQIVGRCETQVAMLSHGLRVELSWNTNDTDVDLHAITSADARWVSPADAYYANRRPDEAQLPEAQRRWLDTDDVDGEGPENIRVDAPQLDRDYLFGVHYYSAHGHADATTAIVVIYCGEQQVARFSHPLVGTRNVSDNDFWRVASVRFDAQGHCAVHPINAVTRHRDVANQQ